MTREETLGRAAAWWREQITAPAQTKFNNGDVATSTVGRGLSALLPPTEAGHAELAKFELLLLGELQKLPGERKHCFGVDYDPDSILAKAAYEAGLRHIKWPWKTLMWISLWPNDYHVEVSAGYGAPHQRLTA